MEARATEPQRLGPYRLVERIGEGGMGVVHLAVNSDGILVAVKVLRPWLIGGHDARARFAREVQALRRVRGPRVAEVLDADVETDPPYVVTRYVRGPSLDRVVADYGPLRGAALRGLAVGLAEALASVHHVGVVHRDVKPGNVLLADGGPVLIDFGLARAADETRLTATGLVIGTPGYLAPETIANGAAAPATDVHGWAATVAFAASGRPPYGRGPDAAILDRIRRGQHDLTGVPPRLAALLDRALGVDPRRRPTVDELLDRLAALDGDVGTTVQLAVPTAAVPASAPRTRDMPQRPAAPAPQASRGQAMRPDQQRVVRTWPVRVAAGAVTLTILMLIGWLPYVGALAVLALIAMARVSWRTRWRLRDGGSSLRAAAGTPWDLVMVALPALAHWAWAVAAGFAVGTGAAASNPAAVRVPYLLGGAVALALVWVGPGTARVRYGMHEMFAPLERSTRWALAVAAFFLVAGWTVALIWDSYGTSWLPATGPPQLPAIRL